MFAARVKHVLLLWTIVFGFRSGALADEVNIQPFITSASVYAGPCSNSGVNLASCSASNANVSATALANASAIWLTINASESIPATNPLNAGGSASATVNDNIYVVAPGFQSGYLAIYSTLTGGNEDSCTGPAGGSCYRSADTVLTASFNAQQFKFADAHETGLIGTGVMGTGQPNNLGPWIVPVDVGTQYTFSYTLTADESIDCGTFPCTPGHILTWNSLYFDPPPTISLLDPNMQIVSTASIGSVDGINYSGAPEPSSVLLVALGTIAVAMLVARTVRLR